MPEFTGKVVKGPFGTGSKSEHEAVYLDSDKGRYVLRRQGGNPFYDPELQKLVGRDIRCTGEVHDYLLMISSWKIIG
jgi:hypothetical protein